jgi:hypothetical protein
MIDFYTHTHTLYTERETDRERERARARERERSPRLKGFREDRETERQREREREREGERPPSLKGLREAEGLGVYKAPGAQSDTRAEQHVTVLVCREARGIVPVVGQFHEPIYVCVYVYV